ncbi:GNAT family N-acetyltransferase [Paenarthrobacter sp. Z7-10]|uniref:GNAT family N-acetyltransferase n=1 Tax=Paenarthrobacter sp. Z7-10 TaxID=2787635 RepID=UPI0022A9722D|nr:GNAT family N-acetyltransferase [Paenarthrobacter sp. Z7-10]MCZ2402838.1 GNAT family N-acetyltransferase [Paenarthrobacter sp. Z7-10]
MTTSLADSFETARTEHLRLRRPVESDLAAVYAIHADPATNIHNPFGPDLDREASRSRLQGWIRHWQRYGFGYWTLEVLDENGRGGGLVEPDPACAVTAGFAGLRRGRWLERDILNLYYRLAPSAWGSGFAAEAARHAVGSARLHFPDTPVIARTTVGNLPSQRTAAAAGLIRRTDLDRDDGSGLSVIFSSSQWPEQPER